MKSTLLYYVAVALFCVLNVDASPFQLRQRGISRSYEIDRAKWASQQVDSYDKVVGDLQRLDRRLVRRYLQKRVFIAGAEDGSKELGLESQAYDPVKSLEASKKSFEDLSKQQKNDKGGKWEKVDGKWKETSGAIKNGPSREETIKELPGLVPGTKGSDRFEKAWKDSEPGKITKDGAKVSYQKSMPGPDAMSDQALNNYSKKMYEDGNKKAKELGMPDHSNMAAAGFSQKPTVAEWERNSRDKLKKDDKGKYIQGPDNNIHKDTKSPIDMSLTSKGPGSPPLSEEYQHGVDKASELQKQQALKQKDASTKKNGETRKKDRWKTKDQPQKSEEAKTDKEIRKMEEKKRKPKMGGKPEKIPPEKNQAKCTHTTGGNCAEKGTLPKANKDSSGNPAPGSASAAYGQAAARPGHKPDLMNNDPPSDKPGHVGTHPGCSGKDPKIGCDKVLEHNKVKDINGKSPGTQDAQFSIPKGNTANKAKELADKLGANAQSKKPPSHTADPNDKAKELAKKKLGADPQFKKLPSHKTDQNGKPIEHRVPKGATDKDGKPKKPDDWELPPKTMTEQDKKANADKKEQAIKETTKLAQAREKGQSLPKPQNPEEKQAEANRIIKQSKDAKAKSQSKITPEKQQAKQEKDKQAPSSRKKKTGSATKPAGKENKEPKPKSERKKEKSTVKQEAKANEKKYSNKPSGTQAWPKDRALPDSQSKKQTAQAKQQGKQSSKPSQTPAGQQKASGQQKSSGRQTQKNNLKQSGSQTQRKDQTKQTGKQTQKKDQSKPPGRQTSQPAQAKQPKNQAKETQQKQGGSNRAATSKPDNKSKTENKAANKPSTNNKSPAAIPAKSKEQKPAPRSKTPDPPKAVAPKAAAPAAAAKPKEQPKPQTTTTKKKGKRDVVEPRVGFTYDDGFDNILETREELMFMQSWIIGMMKRSLIVEESALMDEYIWG